MTNGRQNRTDDLESKLKAKEQLSQQLQNEIIEVKLTHNNTIQQLQQSNDDMVRKLQVNFLRI